MNEYILKTSNFNFDLFKDLMWIDVEKGDLYPDLRLHGGPTYF